MVSLLRKTIRLVIEGLWDIPDLPDLDHEQAEGHFDRPPSKEEIAKHDLYYGRNVIWLGRKGSMYKATADEISPAQGNQWNWDELAAIKKHIEDSEERVYIDASPAQITTVDLNLIEDTQRAHIEDRLGIDYDQLNAPFSIGDEDLDAYLGNPELWDDENHGYYKQTMELLRIGKKRFLKKYIATEGINGKLTEDDQAELEHIMNAAAEHREMRRAIKKAIRNQDGDLGNMWIDLRDGNHRAFGALAAGEPYVWVYAREGMISPEAQKLLQ